jgi:hypothetical protein
VPGAYQFLHEAIGQASVGRTDLFRNVLGGEITLNITLGRGNSILFSQYDTAIKTLLFFLVERAAV